ncbi:hypothetical protein HG530_013066 [Fusarium avenaceum]|nr:hypothetical protein HG530_013066 [Fusarium avenaceum]
MDRQNEILRFRILGCLVVEKGQILEANIFNFGANVLLDHGNDLTPGDIFWSVQDVFSLVVRHDIIRSQEMSGENSDLIGVDNANKRILGSHKPEGILLPGLAEILDQFGSRGKVVLGKDIGL